MYRLAEKIKGTAPTKGVELATVKALDPFTLDIGGAVYSADKWVVYLPCFALQDAKLTQGVLYRDTDLTFDSGAADSLEADALFAVGDVVAVQELGGKCFLVLAKLKAVI